MKTNPDYVDAPYEESRWTPILGMHRLSEVYRTDTDKEVILLLGIFDQNGKWIGSEERRITKRLYPDWRMNQDFEPE